MKKKKKKKIERAKPKPTNERHHDSFEHQDPGTIRGSLGHIDILIVLLFLLIFSL